MGLHDEPRWDAVAATGCDLTPDSAVLVEPLSGKCCRGAEVPGYERNMP